MPRRLMAMAFLLLVCAVSVYAAISHVNTTGGGAASCGSSFSSCATFSWGTTTSSGDFVVIGWQGQYTDSTIDISSVTDNGTSHATWNCPSSTKASVTVSAGVSVGNTKLCYAFNTPAGISNVTVNFNKTAIDGGLDVTQWRGVATSADPTDSAAVGASSNLTCSTTNCVGNAITPTTAAELLIENTYVQNQVQSVSSSGGTWTLDGTPNGNGLAFRIVAATTTTTPTFVVNTTGKYCWSSIGFWMTAPVFVGGGHAIIF